MHNNKNPRLRGAETKEEVKMKKLLLAVLICTIATLGLMGCGKQAGTGDEHPKSEHPK